MDKFEEIGIQADLFNEFVETPFGDVQFVIGVKEFVAIKSVLCQKSFILKALFEQKPCSRYIVNSIDENVFQTMLEYIQNGKIGETLATNANGLLEAAQKVRITDKDIPLLLYHFTNRATILH